MCDMTHTPQTAASREGLCVLERECVCSRGREREMEKETAFVRESECVCVSARQKEKERECVYVCVHIAYSYV